MREYEIYIHIPFCVRKCAYCDFLSGPATEEIQQQYAAALQREIETAEDGGDEVISVFIGGGTPSILDASLTDKIMTSLYKKHRVSPEAEITIEANPGTLHLEKLKEYRRMGINRLSLGLQSPEDGELRMLGRIHSFRDFLESYEMARKAGFDNINVDLMMALPGQTRAGWRRNLETAAGLAPEHVSAYSLIIEEGTPFAGMHLELPDEETEYAMYEDTAEILERFGYWQYEISNYARPGRECIHNIGYWIRRDYIGYGLGAASLRDNERWSNTRDMERYLGAFKEHSGGIDRTESSVSYGAEKQDAGGCRPEIRENREILSVKDAMAEQMFLGLRMTQGVSRSLFYHNFRITPEEVYGPVLRKYTDLGFLETTEDYIRLSRSGIHVSNVIMSEFL